VKKVNIPQIQSLVALAPATAEVKPWYLLIPSNFHVDCSVLHCKTCSGPGTGSGICTSCKDGFALNEVGFCIPCQDKGCKACLWTGTRQCAVCEANYDLKDNECSPCEEGKSSPPGPTKPEGCQSIQMNSSSNSSLVVVLGAVGIILAFALIFLCKKTNIFGSKK